MILLKTAWADFRKNLLMNLFIILQVAVSLVITAVMISTISIRTQYYTPFRDMFTSNGLFLKFNSWLNLDTDFMRIYEFLDEEDILEICSDADHVYSCYTLYGGVDESLDWDGYQFISYDDEFLERYQPDMVAGRWLNITTEPDNIEVVVSENDYGVEVGDVLTISAANYPEDLKFTATVVGIFQDGSKIVGGALNGT
ncbi:MAG: hypothetical protein LUF89_08595 [Ruminococcus sp.]|nr:hypothetical protein [Ruminococcus sp.]